MKFRYSVKTERSRHPFRESVGWRENSREKERDQGSRVTPRKRVSREKGPLPGRGGNNLPKNSIIGPLISRLRRRDQAALCQGRVRSGERTRVCIPVHQLAAPERRHPK